MRLPLYEIVVMPIARRLGMPPVVVQFFILGIGFGVACIVEPSNARDPIFLWLALGFTVGIPAFQILVDRDCLRIPDRD